MDEFAKNYLERFGLVRKEEPAKRIKRPVMPVKKLLSDSITRQNIFGRSCK